MVIEFQSNKADRQTATIQYILIYFMIQYIGGHILTALGTDILFAFTILFCVLLMLIYKDRLALLKSVFAPLIFCSMSFALTFILTGGSLSIGTILSLLSRFLLIYVVVTIDSNRFVDRFLKLTYLMAIISLVEFAFVQIVGEDAALSLFSKLYTISNGSSWLGNSYGLFLICYNFMDPTRNSYMFGEPGEYQMLIIVAMYFLIYQKNHLNDIQRRRYLIVFLVTMLTIQSTTGYFNLTAFLILIFFTNKERLPSSVRKIIGVAIALFALYMIFGYSTNSFVYRNFIAKVISDTGQFDLSTNTGLARTGPIERFAQTIVQVPLKMIFGVGYDGLTNLPLGGYTTCGLINSIVMVGIIGSFLMYGNMIRSLWISSESLARFLFCLFLVVNNGLSQPDILSIMSVLICMYGLYFWKSRYSR